LQEAFMKLRANIAVLLAALLAGQACQERTPDPVQDHASDPAISSESQQATRLIYSDRPEEAIALMVTYLAAHPKNADAHFTLALAHQRAADAMRLRGDAAPETVLSHLEKAVDHCWTYLGLVESTGDPSARAAGLRTLSALYGRDGLRHPADAQRVARQLVEEDPKSAESYRLLAQALRESERADEATAVLLEARAALPSPEQRPLVVAMAEHARLSPDLTRANLQALANEMMAIGDGWVANEPAQPTGPIAKQLALELIADRLEPNPARKRELRAEAGLWQNLEDTTLAAERADVMAKLRQLHERRPDAR
jgi:tetratricopeptide (TPR) repeat protein